MIRKVAYCGGYETIELIKSLREERGLTLRELSDLSGFTPSAISRWESGQRTPSIDDFQKLMRALDVEVVILQK